MLGPAQEEEGTEPAQSGRHLDGPGLHAIDLALQWHHISTLHFLGHHDKDLVPVHASQWAHLKDHSALQVMGVKWDAFDHLLGFLSLILKELQQ